MASISLGASLPALYCWTLARTTTWCDRVIVPTPASMRIRHIVRGSEWSALVLAAALSCGGSTEPLAACVAPVSISVGTGTSPTFSWSPACGIDRLVVSEPGPPSQGFGFIPRWAIREDGRLIEPLVRYAEAPAGTTVEISPEPLVAGRAYRIEVFGSTGSLGFQSFTP
jgi:hypothetical protein